MLAFDSVPAEKMGLYMGIFNFFIVIPQLVAASVLGFLLKTLFGGAPIRALTVGGVCPYRRTARAARARREIRPARFPDDQPRRQHDAFGRAPR